MLLQQDVILHRDCRGGGLGGWLVEHVLAWAAAAVMQRVTLSPDRGNVPALGFTSGWGSGPRIWSQIVH